MKLISSRLYRQRAFVKNNFFVTTPIYYVNSSPHMGHLYSAVISDTINRFQKLLGRESTIFSTGTDEHGLKVQKAAAKEDIDILSYCNNISLQYKTLFDKYNIHYTDYIRTTEKRHIDAVPHFFNTIQERDFIYKSKYEGWYCTADEAFITNKQTKRITKDGREIVLNTENDQPVEWTSEINYLFKLSSFQDDLLYWLKKEDRVVPSQFQEELKIWISKGLNDISVSRPRSRVPWGIGMPTDEDQTFYVWFDALVNYLTVVGYPELSHWPPDIQIIGHDILRFHGIYWPAFLMAANLEPPAKLLVHKHITVDGVKMSKSLGNVICPLSLLNSFNPDAVRFVLLQSRTFSDSGSWSNLQAARCVNAHLANILGNHLNRCVTPSLNPSGLMPKLDGKFISTASPTCKSLLSQLEKLPEEVFEQFSNYKFNVGIDIIFNMVRTANLFFQEEEPWKLKDNPDRSKIDSVLYINLVAIKAAAICLQPIVPNYADILLNILNVPIEERTWKHLNVDINSALNSSSLGERVIPFKRIKAT